MSENLLVVNQYNYDISWIPEHTDNYIVYDKGGTEEQTEKVVSLDNVGHNIHTYFHHIIENYDNLSDTIVFVKGDVFPRHCSEEKFRDLSKKQSFASLESYEHVDTSPSSAMRLDQDGGYMEINNSWYVPNHVSRHFKNYNQFLQTIFINPETPQYVRFAPGANYVVPKENILKYEKRFYEKLNSFIDYKATPQECAGRQNVPAECHIIERALYTIWGNDYKVNGELYDS